uniref:Nephrocystin-3 n=2 Tax=Kalanchoe fedtschenkoi TaxID=63787 RepID=A0A7N0ZUZ1_KALFE
MPGITVALKMHPQCFRTAVLGGSVCLLNHSSSLGLSSLPSISRKGAPQLLAVVRPRLAVASDVSPVSHAWSPRTPPRFMSSEMMDDFETQLRDLFHQVKTMVLSGKNDDASDLLQANYEAVKEQIIAGDKGIEEAAILDVLALGYTAIGDEKKLVTLLTELCSIIDGLEDDEPILDSILMHMGSMYSALGKFEKSIAMYRRALHILECSYGNDSTLLVTPLLSMAKVVGSIGKSSEAVELYDRTINILEFIRGVESEDLVMPLSALGNLLIKEGKASDAEKPFTRILNIYRKCYGDKDGRVGMAMHSLANVKCAKGNVDEAIFMYKKAIHVIQESNYIALDDDRLDKMRVDLAELLHVVGRAQEGRELLEECLLIVEKYKGIDHPSSVTHLINLATSYSSSKNYIEAERLLRRSLEVMENSVQLEDQSISFPMLHLAVVLSCMNQDEEAEELALSALAKREKAFGPCSPPVGEALDCLISIQTRLGKVGNEIVDSLERVLIIQEQEFGKGSREVLGTLEKMIYHLEKTGDKCKKLPLERRLSMLRQKHKDKVPL